MVNPFDHAFDIREGERIEVKFINETDMWHPMHLHGHTFQVGDGGARKDTVIVRPKQTVTVVFDADNPGPPHSASRRLRSQGSRRTRGDLRTV